MENIVTNPLAIATKKDPGRRFRASGAYPHDPALRVVHAVILSGLCDGRIGGDDLCASAQAACPVRERARRQAPKKCALRRESKGALGALLEHCALQRPYRGASPGANTSSWWVRSFSAGCQSTSGETNVE